MHAAAAHIIEMPKSQILAVTHDNKAVIVQYNHRGMTRHKKTSLTISQPQT